MMYLFNKHVQGGWEQEYSELACDADAMMIGRAMLDDLTCNMVAIYRHRDHDTCGIKDFVVSYDRQ